MIVTLNWLKDFVDLENVTTKEIVDAFTFAGFEIEYVKDLAEKFNYVVVGKIDKLEKHPNADKLQICSINVGAKENLQIITGATNVFEGAFIPVAMDGADLPNGVKIKTSNMRGVESCGMLCSGEELAIDNSVYDGADVDGIMILKQEDCKIGTPIAEILGFNDVVFDVKVLANRPDCQSVMALAKELAVMLGKSFKEPNLDYTVSNEDLPMQVESLTENCPYFLANVVKDVKIQESPKWLASRIKSLGLSPKNNIIDLTNYVLWEMGQPLHAYDYSQIIGNKLIARNASDAEKLTVLSGEEYELNNSMTVIADKDKPVGLAGVMGGQDYSISETTKDIIVEAATFKRENIRRTARTLGISSDAGLRYERGVEPISCELGLNRFLSLIQQLGIGTICKTRYKNADLSFADRKIEFDYSRVNKLLGIEIPQEVSVDILNRLGIKSKIENNKLICLVPAIRADIEGVADIIEEIARIYGLEHLNSTHNDKTFPLAGSCESPVLLKNTLDDIMQSTTAHEIKTFTFISPSNYEKLLLDVSSELRNAVKITNPISYDYSVMRTQMISSLLEVVKYNQSRKNKDYAVYEVGKVFKPQTENLPQENQVLAYCTVEEKADFYYIKSVVEMLAGKLGLTFSYQPANISYLHPNISANIVIGNMVIGQIGKVHPKVTKNYDISGDVFYFEIYTEKLPPKKVKKIKPAPKYPSSTRDLAIVVDSNLLVGDLIKSIQKSAGKMCESVEFFDVYTGGQISSDKKSVAFRLVFRKPDGTLTQEEINSFMEAVLLELEKKYNAKLR